MSMPVCKRMKKKVCIHGTGYKHSSSPFSQLHCEGVHLLEMIKLGFTRVSSARNVMNFMQIGCVVVVSTYF